MPISYPTAYLPRLSHDSHDNHERVEHFVLLEQASADVCKHIEGDVVNQDPVKSRAINNPDRPKARCSEDMNAADASKRSNQSKEGGRATLAKYFEGRGSRLAMARSLYYAFCGCVENERQCIRVTGDISSEFDTRKIDSCI